MSKPSKFRFLVDATRLVRVVEIVPAAVVEIVPAAVVEIVPAAVVEIVPALVVEIVPALVVEMVPFFEKAGLDTATVRSIASMVNLSFLIAVLLVDKKHQVGVDSRTLPSKSLLLGRPLQTSRFALTSTTGVPNTNHLQSFT
ncbi:MAG TPA: hypothetical protein VGQ39_13565 [Pyrinomonadaceae bacterium]|jgi:hypothetical protein|nr:hypothetical protein [Pyrinomonadaceae bacterium]